MDSNDLDVSNVSNWVGRPRRDCKKPVRYWEEYVETDEWYLKKLVEDVPKEEMYAACVDEDFAGLWVHEHSQDSHCNQSRTGYVITISRCPVI